MARCMVTKIASDKLEVRCTKEEHGDHNHHWGPLENREPPRLHYGEPCRFCAAPEPTCMLETAVSRLRRMPDGQRVREHLFIIEVVACEECAKRRAINITLPPNAPRTGG